VADSSATRLVFASSRCPHMPLGTCFVCFFP
jgi:hypothetical protein